MFNCFSFKGVDAFYYYFQNKITKKPLYSTRVAFNTPGSKVNRNMAVELRLNEENQTASLGIITPWKILNANGAFVNSKMLKKVQLSLVLDQRTRYSILSEMALEASSIGMNLRPKFELQFPGHQPMSLSGSLDYKKNRNVAIDINIANFVKEPISLKGNISIDQKTMATKLISNIQLNTPWVQSKLQGFAEDKGNGIYRSRFIAFYNSGKKEERATFNFKFRNMNAEATKKINMKGYVFLINLYMILEDFLHEFYTHVQY